MSSPIPVHAGRAFSWVGLYSHLLALLGFGVVLGLQAEGQGHLVGLGTWRPPALGILGQADPSAFCPMDPSDLSVVPVLMLSKRCSEDSDPPSLYLIPNVLKSVSLPMAAP